MMVKNEPLNVFILTDFANLDPSYSLCRVVEAQVKMLAAHDMTPTVCVRTGFELKHKRTLEGLGARVLCLDPGESTGNSIKVTDGTEEDVASLARQIVNVFRDADVILTHDVVYQRGMFKYRLAARRAARELPNAGWLHWAHSGAQVYNVRKIKRFSRELRGKFPRSILVALCREEMMRRGAEFGYETDEIALVPNPVDFLADFHPAARQIVEEGSLMLADIVGIDVCRLDLGKQPHVALEVWGELVGMGYDARMVFVDFASNDGGSKEAYKKRLKRDAERLNVPAFFTSDLPGGWGGAPYAYCIPHADVMNLYRVADFLIHPSEIESGPLTLPEAMWEGCGMVLNFDCTPFREYVGRAVMGKFSSNVDALTGLHGETKTEYVPNRKAHMRQVAGAVAYMMENDPVLSAHSEVRKTRSLEGTWKPFWAAVCKAASLGEASDG